MTIEGHRGDWKIKKSKEFEKRGQGKYKAQNNIRWNRRKIKESKVVEKKKKTRRYQIKMKNKNKIKRTCKPEYKKDATWKIKDTKISG